MSNPFNKSLEKFRGREVIATTNDGRTFRGFVDRIHYRDRHIVLQGAENLDAEKNVGMAFLSHVDTMYLAEDTTAMERVDLDQVTALPYAVREFARDENQQYIGKVGNDQFVGSFPTVRQIDSDSSPDTDTETGGDGTDGHSREAKYEIVEGHKRIWVARAAGLDTHPVEIITASDWEVAERFVNDHIPNERHINDDGSTQNGWYDDDDIERALRLLYERWGDRILGLTAVATNLERLEIELERAE